MDFPTPAAAFRSAGVCGHVFCSPNPDLKQALFQDLLLVSCSLVIALVSHFRFRFVTLAKCRVTQVSGSCFSFVCSEFRDIVSMFWTLTCKNSAAERDLSGLRWSSGTTSRRPMLTGLSVWSPDSRLSLVN